MMKIRRNTMRGCEQDSSPDTGFGAGGAGGKGGGVLQKHVAKDMGQKDPLGNSAGFTDFRSLGLLGGHGAAPCRTSKIPVAPTSPAEAEGWRRSVPPGRAWVPPS